MMEQKLMTKIRTFLKDDYIEIGAEQGSLWETEESGRSRLDITVRGDALWITPYDSKPKCNFLSDKQGLQKSVDHVLLVRHDAGWEIHLIEMKSTVNPKTWFHIKEKVRASWLNIKALAAVLDIPLDQVRVYTTYEHINPHDSNAADPATRKQKLGCPDFKTEEWDQDCILINMLNGQKERYVHHAIQMQREEAENMLCGSYEIG